jgi:IS5 family transposase
VVHTVSVTPANVADITELPNLLREDDRAVFGDAGYVNDHYKRAARRAGVYWGVELKARPKSRLGSSQKRRNRKHSSIRSRVEHLFRVIKCQFGHTRVRYKGLAKNAAQVFMLVGLANLISSERSSWHDGSNPSAAWGNPQKGSKYLGLMSQNPNFSNR